MNLLRSACAVTLLVVATGFVQQAVAATSVVRRTTLRVRDMERSMAFYRALGFDLWLDRGASRDPDSAGGLPLNGKPAHSRIVVMSGKHDDIAMVGLLQYDQPALAATREATGTIGVTDAVLVIQTDDLKAVYENLKALDAKIIDPPRTTQCVPWTSRSTASSCS
jgi:catechol 2,3-dioxygenase-like lactoylglutathione lyase family enzyme